MAGHPRATALCSFGQTAMPRRPTRSCPLSPDYLSAVVYDYSFVVPVYLLAPQVVGLAAIWTLFAGDFLHPVLKSRAIYI